MLDRDLTPSQRKIIDNLRGRRIAVLGIGVSNLAVIPFLVSTGARVVACDAKPAAELHAVLKNLEGLPVEFHLGPSYLDDLESFDMMVVTPGMRRDLPQLVRARDRGVEETSELRLFFQLCPSRIIGITGSDGKTTTTTITGLVFKAAGKDVFVGGNIGIPLLGCVFDMKPDSIAVLELSSFQLQQLGMSPNIGVVLNVHPNHLDYHPTMEEYIEAKAGIFLHQQPGDFAVLNADNRISREMAPRCPAGVVFFSRLSEVESGAFLRGDQIWLRLNGREEFICSREDIQIPGDHNVENILAATAIAGLEGISSSVLRNVIREFKGVEHRIELVGEVNGIRFYDDSISTTPSRAIAGLRSFKQPVVLIAGGYDKNLPFDEFAEVAIERARAIVLLGATASKIEEAIRAAGVRRGHMPMMIHAEGGLEDAVKKAFDAARSGDVILLSPACASFDMFRNYKERGLRFKEIVKDIIRRSGADDSQAH